MEKKYIKIDKPGKYICTVSEPSNGWIDKNEKTGTPFIRIPCIVDMPESDQHERFAIWYGYLSEKSHERTEETLKKVFNWDGSWDESWKAGRDGEQVSEPYGLNAFIGQKVRLQCDESEWQGETKIKARWLNSFTTKREKNRAEFDKKREEVLDDLKKDYPHLFAKRGKKKADPVPHVEKTHDDDGDAIPF